jgi:hypothetical protein
MVSDTTIKTFKILDPDTGKLIPVEMTIANYLKLKAIWDLAAAVRSKNGAL